MKRKYVLSVIKEECIISKSLENLVNDGFDPELIREFDAASISRTTTNILIRTLSKGCA
jgi:hypothetical protein